ncbi:arsenate reductase (glutaredoxin) [Salinimicrobium tongyeongense]|uniref:Arsenate reductase (Glutaredoxin) n=1 Tax=Salinimicrobium tongyeongense TaxID=2809707 RepID=A0ABY6NP68_9FLAO|nr:arsenate reductase (glutaredoxin) [Salinimicrobium tongyeongense]UZH54690.1 arsenate reductase (glutaredoxin) [Salinimicrobium tongyeongense]
MIKIYHNTRCKKSREGLQVLEESGKDFEVREYLKDTLSEKEIADLLKKLNMAPIELVRTEEKIWKENYRDRDLSDDELVRVMAENPKLIQRPIVETEHHAVVGRPVSNIEEIIK